MAFQPQENPVKVKIDRIQSFDGIFGDTDSVQRRYNEKGWNLSNTVANEVSDFDLSVNGRMRLRDGMKRTSASGRTASIDGLFFFTVSGNLGYGVIYGGNIDIVDLPFPVGSRDDAIEVSPATVKAALTNFVLTADPGYPI